MAISVSNSLKRIPCSFGGLVQMKKIQQQLAIKKGILLGTSGASFPPDPLTPRSNLIGLACVMGGMLRSHSPCARLPPSSGLDPSEWGVLRGTGADELWRMPDKTPHMTSPTKLRNCVFVVPNLRDRALHWGPDTAESVLTSHMRASLHEGLFPEGGRGMG